ncbi:hypothetical protein A2U01_0003331, partial [Trifolium medium]|nr:hypothetical protein [Trifolium medium]
EECLGTGTNLKTLEKQNRDSQVPTMPDDESSKRQSTIVLVHTRQNAQLAMGCSRPEEESQTMVPFLVTFGKRLRTLE